MESVNRGARKREAQNTLPLSLAVKGPIMVSGKQPPLHCREGEKITSRFWLSFVAYLEQSRP